MIPRPNSWPFDTAKLPPREGSVLAHRIRPPELLPPPPVIAICACVLGVLGAVGSYVAEVSWLLLPSASLLALGLFCVVRELHDKRPKVPRLAGQYRNWSQLVTALQASKHRARCHDGTVIRERDHVFLGAVDRTTCPLLVHVKSLQHHVQICGSPASGKTFRFMVPASTQILRRRDSSVVVVDLKGSPDLFNTYRTRAAHLGLPFKYFTVISSLSTNIFNPMLMPCFREFTPGEKLECLLQALGLDYGEGYGRGHYGAVNYEVLQAVLEHRPDARSLRELAQILKAPGACRTLRLKQRIFEQGSGLQASLDHCAAIEQLVATPRDGLPGSLFDAAIDFDEVFERPSVLYFHLPTTQQRRSARVIGRLATGLLVANARRRRLASQSLRPVYVLVDEFLQIVDSTFEPLLQQARDVDVSFWLAHQYIDGLCTPSGDFRSLIKNTCHMKVLFSVTDASGRDVVASDGGEVLNTYTSRTSTVGERSSSTSTQEREQVEQRFTQEDINRVNREPGLGFFSLNPGHGYCALKHMVVARMGFSQSPAEYRRLAAMAWPAPGPGTFIPSALAAASSPRPAAVVRTRTRPPAACEPSSSSESPGDMGAVVAEETRPQPEVPAPGPAPNRSRRSRATRSRGRDQDAQTSRTAAEALGLNLENLRDLLSSESG